MLRASGVTAVAADRFRAAPDTDTDTFRRHLR